VAQQDRASRRNLKGLKSIQVLRSVRLWPDTIQRRWTRVLVSLLLASLFTSTTFPLTSVRAQDVAAPNPSPIADIFRLERLAIDGGAELITIRARLDGLEAAENGNWVPLVTVLRDTLGDLSPENDLLRYVWPLTYTRPTMRQRLSGAIPFLYSRVGNKRRVSGNAPPAVLDLAAPSRDVWNKVFWTALQSLLLDTYGMPVKASTSSYRRNISDYRKSHIIRALSVLTLYQSVEGQSAFSDAELTEIQARLRLTDKTFGGLIGDLNLERYNEKQITSVNDERGHNWELLRQRAEAESLFFEPLEMPDGSVTHALLWIARSELAENQGRKYDKRFLNIANPWSDKRLLSWQGYSETRFVDSENRPLPAESPGAQAIELIPLALYGLDNPKIPMLLVDFRDGLNPKKREMSRRTLQDVTKNILSMSHFGDVPYFLGRTVFDVVTGRRGMDINQPSRLRTYSQLKLLLSLNQSLDPELREQIGNRLERVSLNPLENDLEVEARLATEQYEALMAYAKRPDGLAQKLNRDRRAEMVPLEHGRAEQVIFRVGNILSFGKYTHREKATPEMEARIDVARRLSYHTRFLQEVANSSPQIEVVWDLEEVKRSLRFIADHGREADSKAIAAAAKIFYRTEDPATRHTCLDSLSRIDNRQARNELIRMSRDGKLDQSSKDLIITYLNNPNREQPIAISGSKTGATRSAQQ
jgi:hypothetical protein